MKNKSVLFVSSLFAIVLFLIVSCQKEVSYEVNNANNGGSSGGTNGSASGWSFTHAGTKYGGCVDTAYYDDVSGIKVLSIEGSDSLGNDIVIMLIAPNGKLNTDTYTSAQGAAMILDDANGNTYISGSSASSFSFTVTAVTDTSIKGTFTAALSDGASGTYVISAG